MLGFVFLVILCIAFCDAQAGGSPATLVRQDLNAAEWETSNQNGTISFVAGQLPVYVLEALYASGQVTQGDPISGYGIRPLLLHRFPKRIVAAGQHLRYCLICHCRHSTANKARRS